MANKILLDYFMPISSINPTPQASTAYLKQACVVVAPKVGVTPGTITMCVTEAEIQALTDNQDPLYLMRAGMTRVYILPMATLNLASALAGPGSKFFTLIISSDFDKDDITASQASGSATITSYANLVSGTPDTIEVAGQLFTAQSGAAVEGAGTFQAATSNNATATSLAAQINAHANTKNKVTAVANAAIVTITAKDSGFAGNAITLVYDDNDANVGLTVSGATLTGGDGLDVGAWKGVISVCSDDKAFVKAQNVIENRNAFYYSGSELGKNQNFAFGKLLSNPSNWLNQQFIQMPVASDVDELGEANALFDDLSSFVLTDEDYGNRLAMFAAGGKAIVAPYIKRNLEIDTQSAGMSYVSANMPDYNLTEASLIEDEMQQVIDGNATNPGYIGRKWLTGGEVTVRLVNNNFVASGFIEIPQPKALWRIPTEIRETT